MKSMLNISLRLALICVVAAVTLALVNAVTAPQITRLKAERLQNALLEVTPEGGTPGEARTAGPEYGEVNQYWPIQGVEDTYVVSLTGKGYGGEMIIVASFRNDGEVVDVKLLDNLETPGLGKKAETSAYMDKFRGTGDEEAIPSRKGELSQSQADSISGATITFIGISQALQAGSRFVRSIAQ